MKKVIRIEHKKKRSHHKVRSASKAIINLARPQLPANFYFVNVVEDGKGFGRMIIREAQRFIDLGNPDAARLGLWFLREYRIAHKFWECV